MNWKLRLKNKTTLITLAATIISLVYQVLGVCEIVPKISEDSIISAVSMIINALVVLGIVVDPTTRGIADSERALCYDVPNDDSDCDYDIADDE